MAIDRFRAAVVQPSLAMLVHNRVLHMFEEDRIGIDTFHFFKTQLLYMVPAVFVLVTLSFFTPRLARRAGTVADCINRNPADPTTELQPCEQ
jgi:hypothetical protein